MSGPVSRRQAVMDANTETVAVHEENLHTFYFAFDTFENYQKHWLRQFCLFKIPTVCIHGVPMSMYVHLCPCQDTCVETTSPSTLLENNFSLLSTFAYARLGVPQDLGEVLVSSPLFWFRSAGSTDAKALGFLWFCMGSGNQVLMFPGKCSTHGVTSLVEQILS